MINIHLNGDIVRCPDIASIYIENQQIRDTKKICKYGYSEKECLVWRTKQQQALNESNWDDKANHLPGRCILSGSIDCPGHIVRAKHGNKKKLFKIDSVAYRKVSSSGHYMVKELDSKTLFVTLTFPPFKSKHRLTKNIFENEVLNTYFSKFIHNLRENHHCKGYIAVRERGKVGNRVHFHLLLAIPFISFSVLNDIWCDCIKNICHYSDHALTTKRKNVIIYDPIKALRYICKYVSKAKHQTSDCRIVFMSNNVIQKAKQMRQSTESVLNSFKFDYMKHTSDFTVCYRITDYKEFNRFCNEFLYPFFELSVKKQESFRAFPIDSS